MGQDPLPSQPYREMAKRYSGYASTRVITTAAAAIEDTVAALDWLGDNAARYCVDPERFALFGFSAGAVIALQTTYSLNENGIEAPNISAVASYSGRLIPPNAIDVGDTPLFIIHGMDDLLVNYRHAEAMWARARAVATPVQLHAFMDAGHGVVRLYSDQIDGVPVMQRLITFFDQSFTGQLMPSQMTRSPLSQ
jgi:acetyl esterase/lipase